jgi:hypothetical protein
MKRVLVCLSLSCALAACASPEARRTRGDGPGADVGNDGDPVIFHAGTNPYYKTPCELEGPIRCSKPMSAFARS